MVPLLVILAILAFLVTDLVVRRVRAKNSQPQLHAVPDQVSMDALNWNVGIPDGLFVSPGHSWMHLETSGRVRVGMDDFAWQMMGAPEAIDMPKMGTVVKAGQPFATLYRGKHLARIASPVDGVVQDVNLHLAEHPNSGRKSAYEEGWMALIKPVDVAKEIPNLAIAADARLFLERELNRFRSFVAQSHPTLAMAADGGTPVEGIVAHLEPEAWDRFRREFLREQI